jgi:HEAT repeat protein
MRSAFLGLWLVVSGLGWAGSADGERAARLAELERLRPELVEVVRSAQPVGYTRDGRARFLQPELLDPAAWPAVEQRLLEGGDSVEVQRGLLALLPLAPDWLARAEELLGAVHAPGLRADVVEVVGHSRRAEAGPVLARALGDEAVAVRVAAARGLGSCAGGGAALQVALADPAPEVRAAAAWSVGVRGEQVAEPTLRSLLSDVDAEVRLNALRSLERLVGASLSRWPELERLRDDPDARIRQRAGSSGAR